MTGGIINLNGIKILNGCRCSLTGCEQNRERGSWSEPQYSRMITPDVKDRPMMEQSFPHIEPIMKQINWDKWWFYKNEKNDWGGSLEWTHEKTDFPHYECGPRHPMMHSWFYFFWKIVRPRMETDGIYTSTENSFYDRIKEQYENPIVWSGQDVHLSEEEKWKKIIT